MVTCERCHRKFQSQSALLQHFKVKHPNVTNLKHLEERVASEREYELLKPKLYAPGPSKVKLAAFALIVIIAIGVIGYVAFAPKGSSTQIGSSTKIETGSVAPDFTLEATNGQTFRLSDYRGKQNVLLFFSEGLSCQPCLVQMQDLDALYPQFKSLNTFPVSITGDSLQLLSQWAMSSGPKTGLVLSDQGLQVSKMYGMLGADVSMMPGTAPGHSFVLVNTAGKIVWRHDYGPYNMSVPNDEILVAVKQALGQ